MNSREAQTPFRLLLQVAGQLRSEDLETFRSWVPFLEQAQWVGGRMIMDGPSRPQSKALEGLVQGLFSRIPDLGEAEPLRIACFLLADWGHLEVALIEQVFGLLGDRFPRARIEALLLDSRTEWVLDLVLVVG